MTEPQEQNKASPLDDLVRGVSKVGHDAAISDELRRGGFSVGVDNVLFDGYERLLEVEVEALNPSRLQTVQDTLVRPNTPSEFTYQDVVDWLVPVLLMNGYGRRDER